MVRHLYLSQTKDSVNVELGQAQDSFNSLMHSERNISISSIRQGTSSNFDSSVKAEDAVVQEKRVAFYKILRNAYHRQVDRGEMDARGFLVYSLCRSTDFAEDAASRGLPMDDWNSLQKLSDSWVRSADTMMRRMVDMRRLIRDMNKDFYRERFRIEQIFAFTYAHESARKSFTREFIKTGEAGLTDAEQVVMYESEQQVKFAEEALSKFDVTNVNMVRSHYACRILLNRAAYCYSKQLDHNLITEREAGTLLEEVEGHINDLLECRHKDHSDVESNRSKTDVHDEPGN